MLVIQIAGLTGTAGQSGHPYRVVSRSVRYPERDNRDVSALVGLSRSSLVTTENPVILSAVDNHHSRRSTFPIPAFWARTRLKRLALAVEVVGHCYADKILRAIARWIREPFVLPSDRFANAAAMNVSMPICWAAVQWLGLRRCTREGRINDARRYGLSVLGVGATISTTSGGRGVPRRRRRPWTSPASTSGDHGARHLDHHVAGGEQRRMAAHAPGRVLAG